MFNGNRKKIELTEEEFDEYKNMECLRMWRFPWGLWVMSFICFASATFLVACFTVLEIIDKFEGDLWQIFLILGLYLLSTLFFLSGKIEIVTFDKETKKLYKNKWILCFKWKGISISLNDITDIKLTLNGVNASYSSTLYYKITIANKTNKPIQVLETKNRKKVIEKALKIRAFFNMKGKIPLNDISKQE